MGVAGSRGCHRGQWACADRSGHVCGVTQCPARQPRTAPGPQFPAASFLLGNHWPFSDFSFTRAACDSAISLLIFSPLFRIKTLMIEIIKKCNQNLPLWFRNQVVGSNWLQLHPCQPQSSSQSRSLRVV